MKLFKDFLHDESGLTAIEYAMIGSLMSILVVAGAILIGGKLTGNFNSVGTALQ